VKHFVITLLVTVVAAVALLIAVEPTAQEPDVPPEQTRPIAAPEPTEGPPGSNLEGLPNAVTPVLYQRALAFIAALPVPPPAVEDTAPSIPDAPAVAAGDPAGGGSCAIPQYICDRESGGDPTVYNHQGSGASGKYQFMPRTWNGYGGYANAADAPEWVQDEKAAELWAGGAGCSHWSACR